MVYGGESGVWNQWCLVNEPNTRWRTQLIFDFWQPETSRSCVLFGRKIPYFEAAVILYNFENPHWQAAMKVFFSILLTLSLCADAFVIQTNPASSTTSLKDVGLQWGFDERGYRKEFYLEHWSEPNTDGMQNQWAYDPWSCIGQTICGEESSEEYSYKNIVGSLSPRLKVQAPPSPPQQSAPPQQASPLPPSEPAQSMPDAQVAAPQDAAQMV